MSVSGCQEPADIVTEQLLLAFAGQRAHEDLSGENIGTPGFVTVAIAALEKVV